ncbi:hypothetical protein NMYAN_80003 [Nitrosomonas nitrosa]|uniref:Uncharacterized protein n=1 Tax=Nitrosomonas nitrosa TaxID=52442 RepID=A0A8H8Z1P2_9PROT|nr:hypothetical protein NMYAN_80003 [Nitrosomonas nitrosa]
MMTGCAHGYCLMENHYPLITYTFNGNLSGEHTPPVQWRLYSGI